MMRVMQFINLAGVLALAVLCVAQWQDNRQLNQEINRLEAIRLKQVEELDERQKTVIRQASDLESLRTHLTRLTGEAKETEGKLAVAQHDLAQLNSERDQLKQSVKDWAEAVKARDDQLRTANEQIQELAASVNDGASKYNELATNYNALVIKFNERLAAYNELVTKYNELVKK
jgi:chromosome segregation ATPase